MSEHLRTPAPTGFRQDNRAAPYEPDRSRTFESGCAIWRHGTVGNRAVDDEHVDKLDDTARPKRQQTKATVGGVLPLSILQASEQFGNRSRTMPEHKT